MGAGAATAKPAVGVAAEAEGRAAEQVRPLRNNEGKDRDEQQQQGRDKCSTGG